jgi:heme exporter protein D
MSLGEFLHMGGYAPYIWSCYGLTMAVLIGMEWASRRDLKAAQFQARRRTQAAGNP